MIGVHAIERPLSVGRPIEEAPSLDNGVRVVSVLGSSFQAESIELGLGKVPLKVLGIGEDLCTLTESLGMGQVGSSQPTGIPHTAQRGKKVLERPQQFSS